MTRPLISFDWAIKQTLRRKSNRRILSGFLSELLRQDVSIKSFLESESNKQSETDKQNRVDILCENAKGEIFLIELQYDSEQDYFYRMNFGTAKVIAENLETGDPYGRLKKVFSVNILYFDLGKGKDYVYRGTNRFRGMHRKDFLQVSDRQRELFGKKYPHEFFPEYFIIRVNSFGKDAEDALDEWIYYLKYGELPKNYRAKGLRELEEKLRVESMSATEREEYEVFLKNKSISIGVKETARHEGMMDERTKSEILVKAERREKDEALMEKAKALKQKDKAIKLKEKAILKKEEERRKKEAERRAKEKAQKENEKAQKENKKAQKEKERALKEKEKALKKEAETRLEVERLKKILSEKKPG